MEDILEKLKHAMAESGMSQRELARAIGVTEVSVSRYIHGNRIPNLKIASKIFEVCKSAKSRQEAQHIEMIIDYAVVGDDFQYSGNHGVLIRCKDCKYWDNRTGRCVLYPGIWEGDDYCSKVERKEK